VIRRWRAAWLGAALLVVAGWPGVAHASVFELFGGSPRAVGLAGALTAGASGGEAAFHNPAQLAAIGAGQVWAGLSATAFDLSMQMARPVCTDGWSVCHAQHLAGYAFRAPQLPRDSQGLQLGWAYPLGGVFRHRLSLGAGLALPWGRLIRISGADPQTPHFAQYEGMPDRLAFLFAGAWRVSDRWWLGVGTQILAVLDAKLGLDADVVNREFTSANVRIGLSPRARLTAGVTWHPTDTWWFSLAWRQRLALSYAIPTTLDLGAAARIGIGLSHETLFTPDTFRAGVAWRTGAWLWLGDLGWARWSQAPDPSPQVSAVAGGPLVDGFGLGKALQVGTDAAPIALGMRDVWQPGVAVERTAGDWRWRLGGQYRPTPAARARGPFNYVDNDAFAVGVGLGWRHGAAGSTTEGKRDDPAGVPAAWFADAGLQALVLLARTEVKLDPRDPVGDFRHGGVVWHGSVSAGVHF
jgi:hypothetical protein